MELKLTGLPDKHLPYQKCTTGNCQPQRSSTQIPAIMAVVSTKKKIHDNANSRQHRYYNCQSQYYIGYFLNHPAHLTSLERSKNKLKR
jgi:hypothetical protein